MKYRIIENGKYIEVFVFETPAKSGSHAMDLISLCAENDAELLMLHEAALPQGFFELRTGAAGELLQKLSNYRIKTAVIISPIVALQDRFKEMMFEVNRSTQFRIFDCEEDAKNWLTG